jgi:hypothetical protein
MRFCGRWSFQKCMSVAAAGAPHGLHRPCRPYGRHQGERHRGRAVCLDWAAEGHICNHSGLAGAACGASTGRETQTRCIAVDPSVAGQPCLFCLLPPLPLPLPLLLSLLLPVARS